MIGLLKKTAIATLLLALPGSGVWAQDVTLNLHQLLPIQATIPANAIQPWIEKVETESGGRIKIEHFPSMQLGGTPPELYDQAADGVADIIWTVIGYTPGRFPKTEAFELPFMVGGSTGSSKAFHEYVLANGMDEFSDTHPIVFHTHGSGWIHSTKNVTTLEDVAGQKLRGPTRVTAQLLDKLGATPVGMPVPAVPEAMSKGVIDGAIIPWEVTLPLKMSELAKFHSGFVSKPGLYTATFVMTMNKDSYAALPDDLKAVIDANSGPEVSALFGAAMDAADVIGRKVATDAGNAITELDSEKDRWMAVGAQVTADWIAEMDAQGLDGAALVQSATDFIATNAD
ncbi:TRAP transporter substrate-binding protein [Sulfitobacter sp. MF3-043]|uniref:TRAP transporter substrate-binding protein n=1 Tax=Sulfitobacter sediminivivens TaxID=3252902 RepID=UPI0036DEC22C